MKSYGILESTVRVPLAAFQEIILIAWKGRLLPSHLSALIASMVSNNLAAYEPSKQTRSVLLFWRLPEEWAEVLHSWVISCEMASFLRR